MAFTSDVLVERTTPGQRQSVREQGICFAIILHFSLSLSEYRCHVFVRSDGLACVVIADMDYPVRVAFTLMNKVIISSILLKRVITTSVHNKKRRPKFVLLKA